MIDRGRRRVVLTGVGVVAPNGIGREMFWENSLSGRSFLAPITRFDASAYACRVAGEVSRFQADEFLDRKTIKQTDRSVHMALAACQLAAADANIDLGSEPPDSVGLVFANTLGGMEFAEPELYTCTFHGPERVSAYQAIAWFYAAAQGHWTISRRLLGYAKTLVGDRAGGLLAVGWALQAIRAGECTVAFAGGFDAPLSPYAYLCHQTGLPLSCWRGTPERAYCPYDADRSGLVLAEGSGIVVMEDADHARARGAHIYAEVAGFAASINPRTLGGSNHTGGGLARALRESISDARRTPSDIHYISADGLATSDGDKDEAAALHSVFGQRGSSVPVSVARAAIGHSVAGAGGIDIIWTALMIANGVLLPTPGLHTPDPECGLALLQQIQRPPNLDAAVCLNRGHAGVNASVVLQRYD